MREPLNYHQKNELAGMLLELDITEIHNLYNKAIDNHDAEKCREYKKIQDSITTILEYLEK